ncbi:dehypoxanthine futalosine cyclase [Desulfuribacillus stibiiarsenatis]|uniref:Cyclic dehypoxanthine futalosine synthase n=1 Tax=Desulfuribacillus stibiiarsenatis TaxID=1390249 RepID=A0A1E5L6X8_9FIRM|nr:cyclic dehypoxanthinyl futalosine synthase [Desulfuribacillus stibiiarsenatis]OEH85910.1 dehypoxanthine futalosine cyclase [Desulfuribacillus stibiiarsenatis]
MNPIDEILHKALQMQRVTNLEAEQLFDSGDLLDLGFVARKNMQHRNKDGIITFVIDRNINYTNICDTKCKFCAFYKTEQDTEGYVLSYEQIYEKIEETIAHGGTQILMQGGTHPTLPFEYYLELIRNIKEKYPVIHIHSFSPPEIWHFSKISGLTLEKVISELKAYGLDSIPGGGAEILVDRVRKRVSPNKISADQWIEVMRVAHHLGMKSTATMVFGLGETYQERIEHFQRIRDLQDETGGFTAFIPWSFQPNFTELGGKASTSYDYLRTLAISRIYLDNVPNIQASWVTQGGKMAQIALYFGGNDFGGTMLEENVVRAAGTQNKVPLQEILTLIKDTGYTPAKRNTKYEIIETY